MKIIYQPIGSHLCGQACVAMLMGVTLDNAIELVGKKGNTTIKDLVRAIQSKYLSGNRLTKIPQRQVRFIRQGILRVTWSPKRSHWVIKVGCMIYDPLLGKIKFEEYLDRLKGVNKGRITSYLRIYEQTNPR